MDKLLCECDSLECTERLPLTDAEYLSAREMSLKTAVVLPGHQSVDDIILKTGDGFLVVRTRS